MSTLTIICIALVIAGIIFAGIKNEWSASYLTILAGVIFFVFRGLIQ